MKKIIWIASYPKSGNTYMRLFLTSYFYSLNGERKDFKDIQNIFNMNHYNIYKNIKNFPDLKKFVDNPEIISSFWHEAQKLLSKKINKNLFVKTHNCMAEILHNKFTNENYTKSFVYIVRDPRSVAVSYKHHFQVSYDKSVKQLTNINLIDFEYISKTKVPELISSWSIHYNSWKKFVEKGNGMIVKYEDLIKNPHENFKKILNFLSNYMDIVIDEEKFDIAIKSNFLQNLQKIENKFGFLENPNLFNKFFRKGLADEWQSCLNTKQKKIIENTFNKEMLELGYL